LLKFYIPNEQETKREVNDLNEKIKLHYMKERKISEKISTEIEETTGKNSKSSKAAGFLLQYQKKVQERIKELKLREKVYGIDLKNKLKSIESKDEVEHYEELDKEGHKLLRKKLSKNRISRDFGWKKDQKVGNGIGDNYEGIKQIKGKQKRNKQG
jgi:hypothetical protein